MLLLKEKNNEHVQVENLPIYLTSTTFEIENMNSLAVQIDNEISLFIVYSAFVGTTCGLNFILFSNNLYYVFWDGVSSF